MRQWLRWTHGSKGAVREHIRARLFPQSRKKTENIHIEEAGIKNIWHFLFLKKHIIYHWWLHYQYSLKWNPAWVNKCVILEAWNFFGKGPEKVTSSSNIITLYGLGIDFIYRVRLKGLLCDAWLMFLCVQLSFLLPARLEELYGLHSVQHRLSLHPQSEKGKIRIYHLRSFFCSGSVRLRSWANNKQKDTARPCLTAWTCACLSV